MSLLFAPVRLAFRLAATAAAAAFLSVVYVYLTLPDVRPLATSNPTSTAFMELRAQEAAADGKKLRHAHRWVPYARIAPSLKRAVLVAEDDAFFEHEGVDLEQLRKVVEQDLAKGRSARGASTITQQLAKNLYLSPSRNPLRKLRELIIARRLEAALSKTRILELYLNLIEWGDGIWGAEAAARAYFGVPASALTSEQAALLAGAIINPRRYSPARPPVRLLRRQKIILARMGSVIPPPVVPAVAPTTPADAAPAPGAPDAAPASEPEAPPPAASDPAPAPAPAH